METKENTVDLLVVGGGAAGFFTAILVAESNPGFSVLIIEKSSKLLAKVKVSGGGRCNVTHHCFNPFELASHYPRGEKFLKTVFKKFQASDMIKWLSDHDVEIKSESDGRIFPVTDNSQTIIDCFMKEALSRKIRIEMNMTLQKISKGEDGNFIIQCGGGRILSARKVMIAIGGNPNKQFYQFIEEAGIKTQAPIPSLFTFNDSQKELTDLMGVAVANAEVRIVGTKIRQQGPVLITHWGLSGPAVIRLSAWAAEYLHQMNYHFSVTVNWTGVQTEETIREFLAVQKNSRAKQKIMGNPMFGIPSRLWERICALAEIPEQKIWSEIPNRNLNKLIEYLIRCPFNISGKTTFKEEFVTCGGVNLDEINMHTMESKKVPNLYFAGEVLNLDGETGGFNFQAAWSTAFVAAQAISGKSLPF